MQTRYHPPTSSISRACMRMCKATHTSGAARTRVARARDRDASRRRASRVRAFQLHRSRENRPSVHGQVNSMSRYNCLKCPGYCCSHSRIAVSEHDIARLAGTSKSRRNKLASVSRITTRRRTPTSKSCVTSAITFTNRSAASSIRTNAAARSTKARPNVCRKYPYGNSRGYYSFLKFEREHQADEEFIPSA